jgi:hypothetical protein
MDKGLDFVWKMIVVAAFILLSYVCMDEASNACATKNVIFKHNNSQFTTNSFTWHGRMVVPLRTIIERFDVCIAWNDAAQEATIRPDYKTTITFTADSNEVYKNGKLLYTMDVAPIMRDGRMFIPIRYAVEALGKYMQYYEDTCVKVVSITDQAPTQDVTITKVKHIPTPTPKVKLIAKKGGK